MPAGLLQPLRALPAWPGETPGRRSAGRGYRRCVSKPSSGSSKSLVRKTASSLLCSSTCCGQSGWRHQRLGRVVQRLPVVRRDRVVLQAEERLAHLDQPTVLDRVVDRPQVLDQPAAPSPSGRAPAPRSAPSACRPSGPARCSSDSPGCRPACATPDASGLMCVCGSTSTSVSSSSNRRWRRSRDMGREGVSGSELGFTRIAFGAIAGSIPCRIVYNRPQGTSAGSDAYVRADYSPAADSRVAAAPVVAVAGRSRRPDRRLAGGGFRGGAAAQAAGYSGFRSGQVLSAVLRPGRRRAERRRPAGQGRSSLGGRAAAGPAGTGRAEAAAGSEERVAGRAGHETWNISRSWPG